MRADFADIPGVLERVRRSLAQCVEVTRKQQEHYKRTSAFSRDRKIHHGATKVKNFDDIKMTTLDEHGALTECAGALRCVLGRPYSRSVLRAF